MKIRYLGHSAFMIDSILIDPYITDEALKADLDPDYICITHDHPDHLGDAISIAKKSKATIIAIHEIATDISKEHQDIKTVNMNIGGAIELDGYMIKMVKAEHSSRKGVPCGYIITHMKDCKTIYHAGDTALFSDMKLFSEYEIDYALLPIGGRFTMDSKEAVRAAEFIDCKNVIPMHYNTWDIIRSDPQKLKEELELESINVKIMQPGDEMIVE